MKNKTIKTITCLLAGLTLSACAGAGAGETATTGEAGEAITADDLQVASGALVVNDGDGVYAFANDRSRQSWRGLCAANDCNAYYPDTIDITPLADNSGRATYTGTINLEYLNNAGGTTERVIDAIFKVNFDDSEILYDGKVSELIAIKMRADFTPRGLITGTLSLNQNEGAILGVIGQTEMAGSFTTPFGREKPGHVDFAGGFTASRD